LSENKTNPSAIQDVLRSLYESIQWAERVIWRWKAEQDLTLHVRAVKLIHGAPKYNSASELHNRCKKKTDDDDRLLREFLIWHSLKFWFLIWHYKTFSSLFDTTCKFLSLYDTLVHFKH
jgi:hypothetical protein